MLVDGKESTLSTMGVDIGALVAALGLTSLAVGLALKDTIENAITGVLLLIQRPFKVGDVIKVSDVTGTVADVAIRTTNIKTFDGLHVLIPNRHVYNEVITNWTYYPTRRVTVTVASGPAAAFEFTADDYQIAQGACTTLRWRAQNVSAVYLNEQPVAGDKEPIFSKGKLNREAVVNRLTQYDQSGKTGSDADRCGAAAAIASAIMANAAGSDPA